MNFRNYYSIIIICTFSFCLNMFGEIMLIEKDNSEGMDLSNFLSFSVEFPASFTLLASMNPCPCGYYNHPKKQCVCAPGFVQKYLNRISGPLLDRIDLHVEVVPVAFEELTQECIVESSMDIRERVVEARSIQENRFDKIGIHCNAQIDDSRITNFCTINIQARNLLKMAMERLNLSARAYNRILKVSRTIADLEGSCTVKTSHISEAINYRSLDREKWVS